MSYEIEYTNQAEDDFNTHKRSGDRKILIKIDNLLNELREHPFHGTGKPERLKYYDDAVWSRRINTKHRLVYKIYEITETVIILASWGHYQDK